MGELGQESIGSTAGRIWHYLSQHGAVTSIKLKAALGVPNTVLFLALGWLEREDKVSIAEFEHNYTIALK